MTVLELYCMICIRHSLSFICLLRLKPADWFSSSRLVCSSSDCLDYTWSLEAEQPELHGPHQDILMTAEIEVYTAHIQASSECVYILVISYITRSFNDQIQTTNYQMTVLIFVINVNNG